MTWLSEYGVSEPLHDVRCEAREAEWPRAELLTELTAGQMRHEEDLRVVARSLPRRPEKVVLAVVALINV